MIKYTLKCSNGHVFDGWFSNSVAFDEQKDMGLVSCPSCGETEIKKTLMAPSITGTKTQGNSTEQPDAIDLDTPIPRDSELLPTTIPEPLVHGDETMQAVVEKMRELRSWVEANTENVGDKFADKARKMHFGEEDRHGIIGKATFEEAQELIDDGVDFLPLPALPEDNN
ncbi:MAG: DUF1178 family protein [Hyphomicrobiales bacterium]